MRRLTIAALSIVLGWSLAGVGAVAQNYDSGGMVRFGAFAQMSRVNFDIGRVSNSGATGSASTSDLGLGGGISAGYDLRVWNSWTVGIEGDLSLDNAGISADFGRTFNSDYFATVRGRLGYNVTRSVLMYGTAGYALHGLEYRGLGGTNTSPAKVSTTQGGWVAGVGAEYKFDGFALFGEFLHSEYDTWAFTAPEVPNKYRVDDVSNVFRLGIKFNIGYDYDNDIYARDARRH